MNETVIIHRDECNSLLLCDERADVQIVETAMQGLRGPAGAIGPQGPQGIPGPPGSGVVYQPSPPTGPNLLWVRTTDGSIFHEESGVWVSEPRTFQFSSKSASNAIVRFGAGDLLVPFQARLSGIQVSAFGNATIDFDVLKNGTSVYGFALSSGQYRDMGVSISLAQNDIIQIRAGIGSPAINIAGFIFLREVVT